MVSSATPVPESSAEQAAREALFRTAGIDPHEDDFIAAVDAYRAAVLDEAADLLKALPLSGVEGGIRDVLAHHIYEHAALRDAQTGGAS